MPAQSRRQQRYLYAKFGEGWVRRHHFDKLARALAPRDDRLERALSRPRRKS